MVRIKEEEREQTLAQTRQRLLTAAAEEFARAGFAGANINTISIAAGYAKGTVYNYFPSKQALLLALVDDTARTHLAYIRSQVEAETDPLRRLERFYAAGFAFVQEYLAAARTLFNTINGPDEAHKAHVFAAYQPMFQFMAAEILSPGMAQGCFRIVDSSATTLLLMTIYLGTASQVDPQGRPWLDPTQVAGLVLHGLQAKTWYERREDSEGNR